MNLYHCLNSAFFDSCLDVDKSWQKRKRTIDTRLVILFLMKIISGRNKHGYSYIINEIWDECHHEKIPLPQNKPVSASSMYEARYKSPDNAISIVNKNIISVWENNYTPDKWKGHRVFAIDGSKLNVPRELVKSGYRITEKTSRHYPYAMMSCLYDVLNNIIYHIDFVNHNNERSCAEKHFQVPGKDAVIIFDRGYFSYYMLSLVIKNNLNAIFRIQEGNRNKEIRDFSESDSDDVIINYTPSEAVKSDLRKRDLLSEFPSIELRLIKYRCEGLEYIIATTLIESGIYEPDAIGELYHKRWCIEELYKLSKSIICIEDFHSHNEKGVKQEIETHVLLLNLIRISENDLHTGSKKQCSKKKGKNGVKMNIKNCLFFIVRHLSLLIEGFKITHLKTFSYLVHTHLSGMVQRVRPGRHYIRKSMLPRTRWNSFEAPARS